MPLPQKTSLTKRADDWRRQRAEIQRQHDAEAGMRRQYNRARGEVLDQFNTPYTSHRPINMMTIRKGDEVFTPNARLDDSFVLDRRGPKGRIGGKTIARPRQLIGYRGPVYGGPAMGGGNIVQRGLKEAVQNMRRMMGLE